MKKSLQPDMKSFFVDFNVLKKPKEAYDVDTEVDSDYELDMLNNFSDPHLEDALIKIKAKRHSKQDMNIVKCFECKKKMTLLIGLFNS